MEGRGGENENRDWEAEARCGVVVEDMVGDDGAGVLDGRAFMRMTRGGSSLSCDRRRFPEEV